MAYRWRYLGSTGEQTDGPDEEFADQAEAEAWFGSEWEDLRERGVDAVELIDPDGTPVYGPMSLHDS
jgi:hypothetical protein